MSRVYRIPSESMESATVGEYPALTADETQTFAHIRTLNLVLINLLPTIERAFQDLISIVPMHVVFSMILSLL